METKEVINETFGEEVVIRPGCIEDDPRWPVPSVGLIEAMEWAAGPFKKAPLIVRPLEGGRYAPVSPIRSFAARKALVEAGKEEGFAVRVCDGLSAEDAVAVHDAVEWHVSADRTGEWMHRLPGVYAALEPCAGKPWMVGGPWRFMAAACGTSTAMLTRVQRVAHDAVPEVVALVEEGAITMRAANGAARLPAAKQRAFAEAVRKEGAGDPRRAAMVLQRFAERKERTVPELVSDIEGLARAVAEGRASVGVEGALRVQAAAGALVRAACGR